MNDPALELDHLVVGYPSRGGLSPPVAQEISASLRAREIVCLIGRNGAGKSTLLRTIAGSLRPISGQVLLQGRDIRRYSAPRLARQVGVVLTERPNVGTLSVYALVSLGRHPYTSWTGRLTPDDHKIIRWALDCVGARSLAHRSFSELSDGEGQRVLLARALAQQPRLLILDEITAFLDLPGQVEIMALMLDLVRRARCTILLSIHDLGLAMRVAERIWLLGRGGSFYSGAPEDLALAGVLESEFSSPGAEFDPLTGSLQPRRDVQGDVEVRGSGLAAEWTARALLRAGFRARTNQSCPVRVSVVADEAGLRWQIRSHRGMQQTCRSILDLVTRMRNGH